MKLKNIFKSISKIRKVDREYFSKIRYLKYYKNIPIKSNLILLEAQNSNSYHGNIYYIAKELQDNIEYKNFEIYFSIHRKKYKSAKKFFKDKGITNVKLIKFKTLKYYRLLASAKFLFTDTSLQPCYIKKDGQVICNTWHGTPLKTLGKKVNNDFHDIGNIQKNFVVADYLLYPNMYMMEHMIEDYMINDISNAKLIFSGYPRNQVFFDKSLQDSIRKKEQLEKKQIIAYMPTWRGKVSKIEQKEQQKFIIGCLNKIDKQLKENQILYINMHPFINENIDYSFFKNIKQFPREYETYEFLSIADCLITDYSSVFYDFSNTKRKIILFAYDEENYLKDRGLYIRINELPFPKVNNINDLIKEINTVKKYDDTEFLNKFCKYDGLEQARRLCEKVIFNKDTVITKNIEKNGKDNILIYAGNLNANGITTALMNLLKSIDISQHNYFITFDSAKIKNKEILKNLPEGVNYIASKGKMNLNIWQKIILYAFKAKFISDKRYIKIMKNEFKNEIKRLYGNTRFATVIQFNGYDYKKIILYSVFDCNRVIYAHNDMYSEALQKQNSRLGILKYAYQAYDKVALVTEDLIEPISKIIDNKKKIYIANNLIDQEYIMGQAQKEVEFDEQTKSGVSKEKLLEILNNCNNKKIINIGRFSKEKGQERLIDAFQRVWLENNSIYLIIIGGYGAEYNKIIDKVAELPCGEHIIIIKYMSNPFPVLKKCDYFVLSSLYEGFGLVIAEANILGKPLISTNIVGPRTFMKKNKGKLVENSTIGIYKGIKSLLKEEIEVMAIDYQKYNQEAINQFNELLIAK